jgi:hypothetical protein
MKNRQRVKFKITASTIVLLPGASTIAAYDGLDSEYV